MTGKPRYPLIERFIDYLDTVYDCEYLFQEGCEIFDDGEDRFLVALDIEDVHERLLLAKVLPSDGGRKFAKDSALLIETRYTKNTDRFLGVRFYVIDLSRLNGKSEEGDWINFFFTAI